MTDTPDTERVTRAGFIALATVAWLASFLVGVAVTLVYDTDYRQGLRFTLLLNAAILAFFAVPISRRVPATGRTLLNRRGKLGDQAAAAVDLDEARPSALRTFGWLSFPLAFLALIV